MKRFHALEWEDLKWFPKAWRDYGTDYLAFIATKFDIYKAIYPVVKQGLEINGKQEWLDCASGGGGALIKLAEYAKTDFPDLKITLTDYYPNIKAFERTKNNDQKVFDFEQTSVNAMEVPTHLQKKFRTMFGSFHHFRPKDAQQILQNALDSNTPIAIFEPVGRNFFSFLSMIFVPLNVLLLTPFIRPFRWQVLSFIYILPLIPLYILWDGIASIFRTYSQKELHEMVLKLNQSDKFDWEIGLKKNGQIPVFYLFGYPKKN